MKAKHLIVFVLTAIIALTITVTLAASTCKVSAQSNFQTWQMVMTTESGTYTGTLNVQSNGDFTSSGFTGRTSEGTYPINIEGYMSGSSVTFTETATYDHGQGQIYATCSDGRLNAPFPSATSAQGTIYGTITDPLGSRSFTMSWTATKTSGGNGVNTPKPTDETVPASNTPNLLSLTIAGIAGTILVASLITVVRYNSNKKKQLKITAQGFNRETPQWRQQRPMNPQYGPPYNPNAQAPSGIQGSLDPQPITMDHGIPITGVGASVVPPEITGLPYLNGFWEPGLARLSWGTPQYDPSKYRLLGYDISQQTYMPTSTASQSVYLTRVPAGTNSLNQPFNQTFRWNTSGDIAGYRVDPVYGQLNPSGQVGSQFRFGGLGIRVNETIGTFGIGP